MLADAGVKVQQVRQGGGCRACEVVEAGLDQRRDA
jgi:hypothetical protein